MLFLHILYLEISFFPIVGGVKFWDKKNSLPVAGRENVKGLIRGKTQIGQVDFDIRFLQHLGKGRFRIVDKFHG